MAENSKIEWTDHTFNPWIGCSKVHEGCRNCYAEADMDKRRHFAQWGIHGTRVKTSADNWAKPLKWDEAAREAGVRAKVFCSSLADVFEDWQGPIMSSGKNPVILSKQLRASRGPKDRLTMDDCRRELFRLIDCTPNLDWQLLTKRPENIGRMWAKCSNCHGIGLRPIDGEPGTYEFFGDDADCPVCVDGIARKNLWLGTSISNQASADRQIPELLKCRELSPVLFLSMEPLLGPVDLSRIATYAYGSSRHERNALTGTEWQEVGGDGGGLVMNLPTIDWVIVGGESGPNARPMHPDWANSLREQCRGARVSFFFKQWGEWAPFYDRDVDDPDWRKVPRESANVTRTNLAGGDGFHGDRVVYFRKAGKRDAGRTLDGREWSEFPEPATASR